MNFASGLSICLRYPHSDKMLLWRRWMAFTQVRLFSQVSRYFFVKELVLEFELGLELDSAEVRGILLYNNQEWGRFASFHTYALFTLRLMWHHFTGLHLISWAKKSLI